MHNENCNGDQENYMFDLSCEECRKNTIKFTFQPINLKTRWVWMYTHLPYVIKYLKCSLNKKRRNKNNAL